MQDGGLNLGHITGVSGLFLDRFAVPKGIFKKGMHHAYWFRQSAVKISLPAEALRPAGRVIFEIARAE